MSPEFIIRPIRKDDLDALLKLMQLSKSGIASLPADKKILKKRIQCSLNSLKPNIKKTGKEYYLFALEEIKSQQIVGVSGIYAQTGGGASFYAYEIQHEEYSYPKLDVKKKIDILRLRDIRKGPSEVCSLFLNPKYRHSGHGHLLSLCRYLFIKNFPERFSKQIIANLRGYRDEQNKSPFWKALGQVFFEGELQAVDAMKSLGHKSFIKALMPRFPIYIPLLPKMVQETIGKVSKATEPALHLLEDIGYNKTNWIDIFDAGPFLLSDIKEITTFKNAKKSRVSKLTEESQSGDLPYIISNESINFRACLGRLEIYSDKTVGIDKNIAAKLEIKEGDCVSFAKY